MTHKITDPHWELTILDGNPPGKLEEGCGSCAVGDADGDGCIEMFVGTPECIMWYRPGSADRGVVLNGWQTHVGLALADITGDGRLDLACHLREVSGDGSVIAWLEMTDRGLDAEWIPHVIDPAPTGGGHDVIFADVDGDGELELLVNACYCPVPGVFIYKRTADPRQPWQKHCVQEGSIEEGVAVGDFLGDGRIGIASGVRLYMPPNGGPYAGPWTPMVVAPAHREMCRVRAVDITGNGRPDLVIDDSEYLEGDISWFENRMVEEPARPWVEHHLEHGIYYGHSLWANRDDAGRVRIMVAEMAGGGWNAPYDYDARIIHYETTDNGANWDRSLLYRGAGTHEATMFDADGDGELEVVGKEWRISKVHWYDRVDTPSPIARYEHSFIDHDKAEVGTDIVLADIDGDGLDDIVCASWWYKNPTWEKFAIPGIAQVINAYDVDGDGRQELIAVRRNGDATGYGGLTSELVWLKPVDPSAGKWEEHPIGTGIGDWPHGSCVAPVLPGGRLALVTAYHSAHASTGQDPPHYPEIWEVPDDPTRPWPVRPLAKVLYGEEILAHDFTGDGTLDLLLGGWWLENGGDGTFELHRIVDDPDFYPARCAIMDVNGNGLPDVVLGQEAMDYPTKTVPWSLLAWFENPGRGVDAPWAMHVIDTVRCAHSIGIGDLDGDGELEIVAGEHYPFYPYRSRCKLFVYKKADPAGITWKRWTLDDRFEHHDGTKVVELAPGRLGIVSHAWQEANFVHLWQPGAPS